MVSGMNAWNEFVERLGGFDLHTNRFQLTIRLRPRRYLSLVLAEGRSRLRFIEVSQSFETSRSNLEGMNANVCGLTYQDTARVLSAM